MNTPVISQNRKDTSYTIRFSRRRVADSDLRGNLVLDFDADGRIVQIEVLPFNAEKTAQE